MSLRTNLILAFGLTVAVRLGFHLWTGFTADDAFITFRYAENLAAGHGFAYNAGERVLGTSSPLFTWLLSVLVLLRIPVQMGALVVSLICSGMTAVLLYRLATYLRFGTLAWLPAVAYAFWPRCVPAETSGMETALFSLLIMASFYFFHRRLHYYTVGCATLASLTRPEGLLLLVILLVVSCYRERRAWLSLIATAALLLVPWLVFSQLYFGSMLPHAISAKLALYSQFGTEPWWWNLSFMMAWHHPAGWIVTLAAGVGGYWLYMKQYFGRVEIAWLVATVAFFTFGRTHLFFWYPAPLYPVLLLLATAAVPCLITPLNLSVSRRELTSLSFTLLVAVALAIGLIRPLAHYTEEQEYNEQVLQPAGVYLATHIDRELDLVAAEDIGQIGFFSGCRLLDRDGLVSPAAVSYNREARYLDLILDTRPSWVGVTIESPISDFVNDSAFVQRYKVVQVFRHRKIEKYALYRGK
jgi:hypothetical protein